MMIKIGCGIIVFMLSSCACTDHSREFTLNVKCQDEAVVELDVEVLLEKAGVETSEAEQTTEAKIPLTELL